MDNFLYKNKKKVIIAGFVVLAMILVISVVNIIINNMYSVTLNTMVTPVSATVKVGDDVYGAMGDYKIMPGEYRVEVSAEGFETQTGTLTAKSGETVTVSLYLTPDAENADWYETHAEDALVLGEILNNEALGKIQALKDKNPILSQLPKNVDYFTDNYASRVTYTITYEFLDGNTDFKVVIVDYTGGNYERAIEDLAELGVDVDKIKIEYADATEKSKSGYAGD